jgi:hypothetical protein
MPVDSCDALCSPEAASFSTITPWMISARMLSGSAARSAAVASVDRAAAMTEP